MRFLYHFHFFNNISFHPTGNLIISFLFFILFLQFHLATTRIIVLVVDTAVLAALIAPVKLALVDVSTPKFPAMRGISPADSINPSPIKACSRNTRSPAIKIVACKKVARHSPMICLHQAKKSSE